MLDLAAISALTASAVSMLAPLLQKALEKGTEELGKSTAMSLLEKLKRRLKHSGAEEALHDLGEQPADADSQATLRSQLKKAIALDPELAVDLQKWMSEAKAAVENSGVVQEANVSGNDNKTIQIHGSGNSVG
jgi:hypothetical protein